MSQERPLPYLSVIIPCYNEETNLRSGRLDEVHFYLQKKRYRSEIIVVNDGSTDDSWSILNQTAERKEGLILKDIPHTGKPGAVWAGIKLSSGEIILITDMDQSTPIREVEKLLPWYAKGFDAVIGSRPRMREGLTPLRLIGSIIFRNIRRLILLRTIMDTQCGFKTFRSEILKTVFPELLSIRQSKKTTGWKVTAFDVELLFLLHRYGHRIKEVGVKWRDRDLSKTKIVKRKAFQYFHESLEMAREIIRVKVNEIKGLYGHHDAQGRCRFRKDSKKRPVSHKRRKKR